MYKRLNESERNRPEISINGWKRERKRERRGEENVKKRNKKGDAWEIQKQERLWGNENSSKQEREKRFEIDAKNIEKRMKHEMIFIGRVKKLLSSWQFNIAFIFFFLKILE